MYDFQVSDFFTRLIQRVAPKSYQQALGEVYVTQKFLENFSGDQVYDDNLANKTIFLSVEKEDKKGKEKSVKLHN